MTNWIRKRWTELRFGFSLYMNMPLALFTSATVLYKLLIVDNEVLAPLFPSFTFFGILMISIIVPVAVIFGHFHNKDQLEVDLEIAVRNNPLTAKFTLILLRSIRKTASEEEMNWLDKELVGIVDEGKKKDSLKRDSKVSLD